MLPRVITDPVNAVDFLEAYTANYIEQEIQQEAITRSLNNRQIARSA